ncbi:hypothetical protein [Pseudomonas sp. S1_E04]
MMLLRTLVLERSGEDAPVNGALLCGFAVPQIASNFLVYSLDEEAEPGSSRVYVAALQKKLERYFLSGVESQEDLQVAMRVFKQILMLAASGAKSASVSDSQVPYHFVDLKGCKLPPARPADHHSMIIKKVLVMKVITLGTSAPASTAIESAGLIVPSIRFSSRMISAPKVKNLPEASQPALLEQAVEPQFQPPASVAVSAEPSVPVAFEERPVSRVQTEQDAFFEVDSTLTNLARVSQELAQQKLAALKQEEALELWRNQLQQNQTELDQKRQELVDRTREKEAVLQLRAQVLEGREAQVENASVAQQLEQQRMDERARALDAREAEVQRQAQLAHRREEKLAALLTHFSGLRQNVQAMFSELDQALESLAEPEQAEPSQDPWTTPV